MRASVPVAGRIGCAIFTLLSLTLSARAEPSADPLSGLLKSKTDSLCYRRDYDAAHLSRHSGQLTQRVLMSFRQDAVRVELRQKDRKPRYVVASCGWAAAAGRDTQGKRLIEAFKKDSGFDCLVMVSPSSAEEGGHVLIDPAADARSLMLYVDDSVRARDSLDKGAGVSTLKLGREDRIFQLTRTSAPACRPMEDALEGP